MGPVQIILILVVLLIFAGIATLILKAFNKKVSFWKIAGVAFLLIMISTIISGLLK